MSDSSPGRSFGQKRPPLSVTIKGILEKYPDGQIFKELIQNADDAKATVVKLVLDHRNQATLPGHPVGTSYQGPALLAYNNAAFSEEDWEGIQSLQQSGKAKDPFKVGKFGIGFNSVYHITDLPVIISDSQCGYLDPHEKIWKGETGRIFCLKELHNMPHYLTPFNGVCGFSLYSQFEGQTLFRFPLRNTPSNISQKCYNIESIQHLIAALKEEAEYLLLFLRSVQSIIVEEILVDNQIRKIFSVSVSGADSKRFSQQRSLTEQVEQTFKGESPYGIPQVVSDKGSFSVAVTDEMGTSQRQWLVVHQVGSTDSKVREQAAKQHVLPWVGTALELSSLTSPSYGRLFCFLPMPIEATAPLPIHVNGTFALNDNRRSLKWPGVEMRNDPSAQWNKLLVEQCIPSCYVELLLLLIEQKHMYTSPNEVYEFWPQVEKVASSKWSGILSPFFNYLFKHPVVYSEANKGCWVSVKEALFVPESGISLVVEQFFLSCGSKITKVISKVWKACENQPFFSIVTPTYLRQVLKMNIYIHQCLSSSDKLELLQYCLSDKQYNALDGLNLLPLANDQFVPFSTSHSRRLNHIYMCNSEYPCFLIPNALHKLVDPKNDTLREHLLGVAQSCCTQLKMLGLKEVAQLLKDHIPTGGYPSSWFPVFWSWVKSHQLSHFDGLKVVPVGNSHVGRLTKTDGVVIVSCYTSVSYSLASALAKYQVKLAHEQQDGYYLEHHDLRQYLYQFNVRDILNAIASVCTSIQSVKLTSDEALALQSFFATDSNHKLPIFCKLSMFSTSQYPKGPYYSIHEVESFSGIAIAESHDYAITADYMPSRPLVLSLAGNHRQLLEKAAKFLTKTDFLCEVIFPMIQNQTYPKNKVDGFMMEILKEFNFLTYSYPNREFITSITNLPFLKTESGHRNCPKNLFDPSNSELLSLFKGEAVFPEPPFNQGKILHALQQCGLRQLNSVTALEILGIVQAIKMPFSPQPVTCENSKYERATAVVRYISNHPSHLDFEFEIHEGRQYYKLSLEKALEIVAADSSWLPVCSSCPINYPSCLPWKGSLNQLVSSRAQLVALNCDITRSNLPAVVGSQVVFLAGRLPDQLAQSLSSSNTTLASAAVDHLQTVMEHKDQLTASQLEDLVVHIYDFLNKVIQRHGAKSVPLQRLKAWVWTSKTNFIKPESAALQYNPEFTQNLQPFLHVLPDKFSFFSSLLTNFGVNKLVSIRQIISVLHENLLVLTPLQAWSMVMAIINWLVYKINEDNSILQKYHILLPADHDTPYPEMCPINELVYTDNEFFREVALSSEEPYTLVHPRISKEMARSLGVVPLSQHLNISEDIMEDAGQHEPLTQRLKNILRDYKDGLTIIKELLQNADDAGATELNILFDARQHSTSNLLFPGMSEAHGPALVVHNNATFTDEDFQNITKLAGATKENKPLKIGKFGIGFCSVYHITDVPSFVSRDYLYILDPTLKHLKDTVCNKSQPGKRVKFTSISHLANSNLLEPYKGLFNFVPSSSFKGTMFRFPFRKFESEISSTVYSEATVNELKNNLKYAGSKLLLFTNSIKQINFSTIFNMEQFPKEQLVLKRDDHEWSDHSYLRSFTISRGSEQSNENWVVANCQQYNKYSSQYSIASVACQLMSETSNASISVKPIDGEVFCFLPLSVATGLPVHISANFAVLNNRRGIWTSESSELKAEREVKWNRLLMQNCISVAYVNLLNTLKRISSKLDIYDFFSLWPMKIDLKSHNPWVLMLERVYEFLSSEELFYSSSTQNWLTIEKCWFILPDVLSTPGSNTVPKCVVDAIHHLQQPVVFLPFGHLSQLMNLPIKKKMMTIDRQVFTMLFYSNIKHFNDAIEVRNKVLLLMLQVLALELENKSQVPTLVEPLSHHPCVPCSPDGTHLALAEELVDPQSELCSLFDQEDSKFPVKEFNDSKPAKRAMIDLGMKTERLPWSMLIDCACGVAAVYHKDKERALKRVKQIISCVKKEIEGHYLNRRRHSSFDINIPDAHNLSLVKFLPVMQKPKGYPLAWKGDEEELQCGAKLIYQEENSLYRTATFSQSCLVGSQVSILNTQLPHNGGCGYVDLVVQKILGITYKPKLENVLEHFSCLIQYIAENDHSKISKDSLKWTEQMCRVVYEYLNNELLEQSSKREQLMSFPLQSELFQKPEQPTIVQATLRKYSDKPFIYIANIFVPPSVVARNFRASGPMLYKLPDILVERKMLTKELGVKDNFEVIDLLNVLNEMFLKFGNEKLPKEYHKMVMEILLEFSRCKLIEVNNTVYLPNKSFELHAANDLCYNDAPWCDPDQHYDYVHKLLGREAALQLGVQPVRSQFLEGYASNTSFGVPFGQHEDLTCRIKNILRDYPFDATFLKELIQNSDDSKATKMYIILDKRKHGTKKLFKNDWKELQGPALLVWNDAVFSEADLEGIQQLGLGSKREDSESIGQFGIGFNVVYHITDCPSFITGGDTLCVLDPHCRYAPGATPQAPGRRFDNVDDKFWNTFSDLKSTYLKDKFPDLSQYGTLFRFPLRHTKELIQSSNLVENKVRAMHRPINEQLVDEILSIWVKQIKNSLLFLNNVCELKFIVINESTLKAEKNKIFPITERFLYKVVLTPENQQKRKHQRLSNILTPTVVTYPLKLTCTTGSTATKVTEQWLVQQGIGDLNKKDQIWDLSHNSLPKHGIAARLESITPFEGKAFCFLPLPGLTELPVHINGHFVLSSNRSSLWKSDRLDKNSEWNDKLIQAIASSYAQFLVTAQQYIIKSGYSAAQIATYYKLFPRWLSLPSKKDSKRSVSDLIQEPFKSPEGEWRVLAESVFRQLWKNNALVLAPLIVEGPVSALSLQWHALKEEDGFRQAYFKPTKGVDKNILKLLTMISMTLTSAPDWIKIHFEQLKCHIPEATGENVLKFYTSFHHKILQKSMPCHITQTPFKTTEIFKIFTKYITKCGPLLHMYYTESPYGFPLLLTADNNLRLFEEDHKVLHSKYSHLFFICSSSFLHPEFLYLSKEYFATQVNESLCCTIFRKNYSSFQQPATENILGTKKLKELWVCLCDKYDLFHSHRDMLVRKFALIPASNNILYSTNSIVLPVVPPLNQISHEGYDGDETSEYIFYESLQSCVDIFSLFQKFTLPILDLSFKHTECYCPKISCDTTKVLQIFHHEFAHKIYQFEEEDVEVLLKYFGSISFGLYTQSMIMLKDLPLFELIDGTYSTLTNKKAFILPSDFCVAGFKQWANFDTNAFLKEDGSWSILRQQLQPKYLDHRELYVEFVFPNFGKLESTQRMEHLLFIRKNLLEDAIRDEHISIKNSAPKFIKALQELPCLALHNDDDSTLLPITEFSDPDIKLYHLFSHTCTIKFIKGEYSDPKWLEFFRQIGLKTKVSFDEFVIFCKSIASVGHQNIREASEQLLKYLFSVKALEWHKDEYKLSVIADICFVTPSSVDHLSWIKAPCSPVNSDLGLTTLRGAAVSSCANCVWTVMPVVNVPHISEADILQVAHYSDVFKWNDQLKDSLGILTELQDEIILRNISCISDTGLANFNLFHTYNPRYVYSDDNGNACLVQVIKENICSLRDEKALTNLVEIPFIPVEAAAEGTPSKIIKPVLVNILQVVQSPDDSLKHFKPYINPLPPALYSLAPMLTSMGMTKDIEPKHLHHLLKLMCNLKHLDVNHLTKTRLVILKMYELLRNPEKVKEYKKCVAGPLYLPNHLQQLTDSTHLIYEDTGKYKAASLKFPVQICSLFQLPLDSTPESMRNQTGYKFYLDRFCATLPKHLQPEGISVACEEQIVQNFTKATKDTHLSEQVLRKKELSDVIAQYLHQQFQQNIHQDNLESQKNFIKTVERIFECMNVTVVNNLTANILLKRTSPPTHLGNRRVPFILSKVTENYYYMYIDSKAKLNEGFWYQLAHYICVQAAFDCSVHPNKYLCYQKFLNECLKTEDISCLVNNMDYTNLSTAVSDNSPKLGQDIDEAKWCLLSRDINNIFQPQEWVGYEIEEDHFIYAILLHYVVQDDEDCDHAILKRYVILFSEEESEANGQEVSALDLFKFVIPHRELDTSTENRELVPKEDITASTITHIADRKVKDLCKDVYKELLVIQKISTENDRVKAQKRLFFKYHPDKAGKTLAEKEIYEKVFKFLLEQIDRLKEGLVLIDPDNSDATSENLQDTTSVHKWSKEYQNWDVIICKEKQHFQNKSYLPARKSTFYNDSDDDEDDIPEIFQAQPKPNRYEAMRWLKQAEADHKAMEILRDSHDTQVSCHISFMAHQTVEKALKAGMYALFGLNSASLHDHVLKSHADAIGKAPQNTQHREVLESVTYQFETHYLNARYPNRHSLPSAPVDVYTIRQAQDDTETADKVLVAIHMIIHQLL